MSTQRTTMMGGHINFQSIPKSLGIPVEDGERWLLVETDCNDIIRHSQIKPTCTPTLSFKEIEGDTRWVLSASWKSVHVHLLIKYWPNGRCGYTIVDERSRVIMSADCYERWIQSIIKLHGQDEAQKIIAAENAPTIDGLASRLGEELIRHWQAMLQLNIFTPEATT